MKSAIYFYFTIGFIFIGSVFKHADATVISNGDGNWATASTWLRNGSAAVPVSGDTILIMNSDIVTVSTQITYTGLPVNISVGGILQFVTGKKLTLPCGSY